MSLDRYTKVVLTLILACLVWISVGGPSLIAPVQAQSENRVLIAGWIDQDGNLRTLPTRFNSPGTTQEVRDKYKNLPLSLPVSGD